MLHLKKLPLGVQTFSKIINQDFIYVDKTKYIYDLALNAQVYFLSRPRRFGKSLLIDTLKELFEGNKELFKDLWIYDKWNWEQKYPVIKLSFGSGVLSEQQLINKIDDFLTLFSKKHEITLISKNLSDRFQELIASLKEKYKAHVVVLIDEYDKPILDTIKNTKEAEKIRDILRSFYGVLKDADPDLRFIFLTGVTKFSKMSVFSGLNNLTDITMNSRFATLTGITTEEIQIFFKDYIDDISKEMELSQEELMKNIINWYNGYRFSESNIKVINPYSLLSFLYNRSFKNFWFETGTPTFLIKLLQDKTYDISTAINSKISLSSFSSYDLKSLDLDIVPLFLQTGYFTIQDYNGETDLYTINFPNFEVERSFYEFLLEDYAYIDTGTSKNYIYELIDTVKTGDVDGFMNILKVFYANIPYDIQIRSERYYQSMFFALFQLIGLNVHAEVRTNEGRIDAVVENKNNVFIFEFKLHGTAQEALEQIKERRYWEKYMGSEKLKVKSEELKVKSEKLDGVLLSEKLKVKSEELKVKSEKLKVKSEKDTLASDSSFKKRENKENVTGDNHRNQDDGKGHPYNQQPTTYQLFLIGIGFDMEKRIVNEYVVERL